MNALLNIDLIAAARPNFMKIAPLYKALMKNAEWCNPRLIHTGQHYDANMSNAFFRDLGLPTPALSLGVGSGTHAEQTAGVMLAYEKVCLDTPPHWTIVVGDVNSTLACTLAATKLGIRVAHLEAGLRSGDRSMPEELNRLATDALSDLLWTPSPDADENLMKEGVAPSRVQRVGNIMIDSLEMMRPAIEQRAYATALGLDGAIYGVVTLHRPSNVDEPKKLAAILDALADAAVRAPILFPLHPRTRQRLSRDGSFERLERIPGIRLTEPLGYVDFMSLVFGSTFVLTDSGGIQEETTYLGIPCLTLRDNTERPITVMQGTNRLIKVRDLEAALNDVLNGDWPRGRIPDLWDGHTALRVVQSLKEASDLSRPQVA